MNTYIGNFRLPIWMLFGIPLLAAGTGWQSADILNDAAYAGMLRDAPHERYGWVVETLPRPVFFAFMAFVTLVLVAFLVVQGLAAITRRRSFVIDARGVRRYNLFTGREKALAWGQIQRVSRYRSNLTFIGSDVLGRRVRLVVSLLGHKRKRVAEVVAAYRPDLTKAL